MKNKVNKIVKNYKVQTFLLGVGVVLLFLTIVIGSIIVSNIPRNQDVRWKDLMRTISDLEAMSRK